MALLNIDGFDHYAAATESSANIATYLQAAGYVVANATAGALNIAPGQDANSNDIKITIAAAGATPCNVTRSVTTAASQVVFGFSFRGNGSRQRICRIDGQVDLMWDATTGKLYVGTDVGTDVIIMNAWWYIELVIDKVANTITVFANDTQELVTAIPGGASGNTHSIMWGNNASSPTAATIEIDDFYILDNSGGANNARVGPLQIISRPPTSDVQSDWTAVGATGTHASIAAQLSPNAANAPYLQANIAGKTDMYASTTVLPNANQIFGVALVSYARKGDLDNRSLGMALTTSGGTTEQDVVLQTTYAYREVMFEVAPGNTPWTQPLVESSNFGIIAR